MTRRVFIRQRDGNEIEVTSAMALDVLDRMAWLRKWAWREACLASFFIFMLVIEHDTVFAVMLLGYITFTLREMYRDIRAFKLWQFVLVNLPTLAVAQ